MKIANRTDSEVRKYGYTFPPESELIVDDETIRTYSTAEVSAALQSIARSLSKLVRIADSGAPLDVNMNRSIRVSLLDPWKPEKISWFKRLLRKAKP